MEAFKECLRVPGRRDMKGKMLAVIYGVLSSLTVTLFETTVLWLPPGPGRARCSVRGRRSRFTALRRRSRRCRSPPAPRQMWSRGRKICSGGCTWIPSPQLRRCLLTYESSPSRGSSERPWWLCCPGRVPGWGRCPATVQLRLSSVTRIREGTDVAHLLCYPGFRATEPSLPAAPGSIGRGQRGGQTHLPSPGSHPASPKLGSALNPGKGGEVSLCCCFLWLLGLIISL